MSVVPSSLPVGPTDQRLDTTIVDTTNGDDRHREGVFIGDPATGAARAAVTNSAPASTDYGLVSRAVLYGTQDSGAIGRVPITAEGHIEVAIHAPRLPFGAIHAESITPVFQSDAVYGVNSGQEQTTTSSGGTVTGSGSLFVCATGTSSGAQAVLQSRRRLRYRPGQGSMGRFTAAYTTPTASSYQLAGLGHSEDGVYFGYGNTSDLTDTRFGILYVKNGVREVRTLTVTAGASSASNCTIVLNSATGVTVALTAASNIQRTVWEISQGTFPGWDAFPLGATVVFVRKAAGVASGTYSFSAGTTGSAASFAQTKAGAASTDTFIPQSTWNGDKLDGTGATGITIDPTKLNVYQINVQYLGAGTIAFQVEIAPTGGNNADFVTVHTIRLPNTLSAPSFGNPSFPFTLAAYSAGSTTNLQVSSASFAGFIEGQKRYIGPRFSYFRALTTVGDTNLQALFTVMNMRYYAGRSNQAVIYLEELEGALKHTSPCILYVIRNGALAGNPSFSQYSTTSCSAWDTAATTVTYSDNAQLIFTAHLGDTGELDHTFATANADLTIQPGEWITIAARAVTGSPPWVTASLNTREDQ